MFGPGEGIDILYNGTASGDIAIQLLNSGFDVDQFRPYIGDDGRFYRDHYNEETGELEAILTNTQAALRKEDWFVLEEELMEAAKPPLNFVSSVVSKGLEKKLPGGWGTMFMQWERMTNISPAKIGMDPVGQAESDRPLFDLQNLPIPIIWKDFQFTARQLAAARKGQPLETTTGQLAARRVAELSEQLNLGTIAATPQFGGYPVYGLVNFPGRLTKVMTNPTANGWTPQVTAEEVMDMKQQSVASYHRGPWTLFVSQPWDTILDRDYSAAKETPNVLRDRIMKIRGITSIEVVDWLAGYEMVLVQNTQDVFRVINGMNLTTLQWPTHGGQLINFKVMMIMTPHPRADIYGNCGIVDGVAP